MYRNSCCSVASSASGGVSVLDVGHSNRYPIDASLFWFAFS